MFAMGRALLVVTKGEATHALLGLLAGADRRFMSAAVSLATETLRCFEYWLQRLTPTHTYAPHMHTHRHTEDVFFACGVYIIVHPSA